VRSGVLRADATSLTLPLAARARLAVAAAYVRLGIVHIATGFDHLLFLLALALQLWRLRAVLLAETAFTLSHTLSFSATALGLVQLAPAAAEACIALSLVLLARELVVGRRISPARGALVALAFGLVHGLGFAGGLREIGLPEHDVGLALVGFGAGVEMGQVAFLALVLLVLHAAAVARRRDLVGHVGGLGIGSVGAFWLCQRLWVLL
jgi:hydrogenase/urease accessory protein HupE